MNSLKFYVTLTISSFLGLVLTQGLVMLIARQIYETSQQTLTFHMLQFTHSCWGQGGERHAC